jgi:plasmid maintenance system antidote protein VapI
MKILKKKTTQKKIAQMALIGPDFLSHIIRGRKQCPPRVAVRLEQVTGIKRETWVWGDPKEIREAVESYIYSKPTNHGH